MGHSGRRRTLRDPLRRLPRAGGSNLLGPEHGGFMIAQARLGPGRIHHCMRAIGMAERAFELMCRHANAGSVGAASSAEKQIVQDWVATSRMEIDQARLLTQYAAWKMDKVRQARSAPGDCPWSRWWCRI
jgi:acyl-CoA dehydrogenase